MTASLGLQFSSHELEQNLLEHISKNPGIRYRQLLRLTSSSNGKLSYHLAELERSRRIVVDRKRGVTRYYPLQISDEILKIIGCIRNSVPKQIISLLIKTNGCTLSEISAFTTKAPSTTSWHLQRLIKAGIVRKDSLNEIHGINYKCRFYQISDKKLVETVLTNYIENALDTTVNDYSDLIDELR